MSTVSLCLGLIYLAPLLLHAGEALPAAAADAAASHAPDYDESAAASSASAADSLTPATTQPGKQEMVQLLERVLQVIKYEHEMSEDDVGRTFLPQVGEFIAALGKLFGTMLGTTTTTSTTPKTG